MGWGDLAREAMNKAVEAYKASIVVSERLKHVLESFRSFELRSNERHRDIESRMRELESRMARIEGRVDAALAEAYRSMMIRSRSAEASVPENGAKPLAGS